MEQCQGKYESAMHYDCYICNKEKCAFRKGEHGYGCLTAIGIPVIVVIVLIIIFC